jgi:DedD protein
MSDPGVREIQLTGKQLVFLFMASLVLAVAIFLLGISVGRGVGSAAPAAAEAAAAPGATADTPVSAELPPATEVTPADLSYHNQLQGQTPPSGAAASAPPPASASAEPSEPPPPVADDAEAKAVKNAPAPSPAPAAPPAATPAPPPASTAPARSTAAAPAPTGGAWFLQINTFRSKDNADRQVADLKSKGYSAFVVKTSAGLYQARVGSFATRDEAVRTAARVKRDMRLTPLVTR